MSTNPYRVGQRVRIKPLDQADAACAAWNEEHREEVLRRPRWTPSKRGCCGQPGLVTRAFDDGTCDVTVVDPGDPTESHAWTWPVGAIAPLSPIIDAEFVVRRTITHEYMSTTWRYVLDVFETADGQVAAFPAGAFDDQTIDDQRAMGVDVDAPDFVHGHAYVQSPYAVGVVWRLTDPE